MFENVIRKVMQRRLGLTDEQWENFLTNKYAEKERLRSIKNNARQERFKNKTTERIAKKKIRDDKKIKLRESKNNFYNQKQEIDAHNHGFGWRSFFTHWLLLGIIFILASICINFCCVNCIDLNSASIWTKFLSFLGKIAEGLASSIGIALVVGCVFDFSKNSEAFTNFVSNIIKRIMVTKEFLREIKTEEKRNVLELLIAPTDAQIEQCSSINLYYKKSIDAFFNLCNKPFKTNLTINVVAKFEDDRIVCEGNVASRRYKTNGDFKSIITTFDNPDSEQSNSYILLPNGMKHNLADESITIDNNERNIGRKYTIDVPEKMNDCPYITIVKDFKERGTEEYMVFNWSSLTPCDGICFELNCVDGLEIIEYKIFDDPNLYEVNVNDLKNNIKIVSNSWLNEYTGFTLLIKKSTS